MLCLARIPALISAEGQRQRREEEEEAWIRITNASHQL